MAETKNIAVRIESRFPVFIEAGADAFGAIFASMDSEEQVAVLSSMALHMRPHQLQWDHISIELEKPENVDAMRSLQQALFPGLYTQASRIEELEKAILGLVPGHRDPDGMCWCSYGHNLNFSDHQPSCITARSALSGEQG